MPRAGRLAVVALLGASCAFFNAGVRTATAAIDITLGLGAPKPAAEISTAPQLVVPTSPESWFQPGGRNLGTENLIVFLSTLARWDNTPLAVTDSWGRVHGSDESDHHISRSDSWAADLAIPGVNVPTATVQTAAERIGSALGEPGWTGGNLVKTVGGYRFQVLWLVAGHFNHVHVGVRKVA